MPLGLLVLVAWQGLVREPFAGALPRWLRERVGGLASSGVPSSAPEWGWAALSVLIGAATHLAWDSFTHPGYLPAQWLGLTAPSPLPGVPWTGVLQRLSDVIGFTVLAVVVLRLRRSRVPAGRRPWLFWLVTFVVTGLLLAARTVLQPGWARLSTVVATLIAGWLLGLLVAAVVQRRSADPASG